MAGITASARDDEEEATLWHRLRSRSEPSARAALFVRHAPFAQSMARRHYRDRSRGDLDLADLAQQASGALLEAIDRYDPERGVPFRSYAARRIAGSLADAITASSDLREQQSARARMRRDRIRSLSPGNPLELAPDAALTALADLTIGLALGFMIEDVNSADDQVHAGIHAYHSAAWRELVERLLEEIATLPDREQLIVREHYLRGVAFETLANLLGLSKGRISQLHHSALLTLKKRLAWRGHASLQL